MAEPCCALERDVEVGISDGNSCHSRPHRTRRVVSFVYVSILCSEDSWVFTYLASLVPVAPPAAASVELLL